MWKAAKLQDASIKTAVVYNWGWIEHFIDDAVDMSMQGNDSRIAQAMSSFVEDEQPELMFLAFDEVDGAGHSFGWGTPAYYSRVSNIDSLIGDVLDSLETAGIADETLVMVTSDHGGDNYGHGAFTQAEMYSP
jgi:predicted AlkP superfamily pyrophosphatase or phosphodiesterase